MNFTLSLDSNPTGATLSGTLSTLTDGSGVAAFPSVSVDTSRVAAIR